MPEGVPAVTRRVQRAALEEVAGFPQHRVAVLAAELPQLFHALHTE